MALGVLRHVCSLLGILLPFSGCGELKGEKVVVKREDKEQELQDTISEFWFYYTLLLLLLFKLFFFFFGPLVKLGKTGLISLPLNLYLWPVVYQTMRSI